MLFNLIFALVVLWASPHAQAAPARSSFGPNTTSFEVHSLPQIDFDVPCSWAGEIGIPSKPGDSLFFWLFEAQDPNHSDDLVLWLNGGPGCSSMTGVGLENGPFHFPNTTAPQKNPYSWTKLANVLYVDQPVGTGYSFGNDGANSNEEDTEDFFSWLKAFYSIFPELKYKRTFISGESYAGVYIPYFTDRILRGQQELSINLQGLSIGDPTLGNYAGSFDVSVTTFLNQSNSILNIPSDILDVFEQADQSCGFDKVLAQATYPPAGEIIIPGDPEGENFRLRKRQNASCDTPPTTPAEVENSINNSCYGPCATFTTAADYLLGAKPCFNNYNINYTCTNTPDTVDPVVWFNRSDVREAIHAANKSFEACNQTVSDLLGSELVMPPAYTILPRILNQLPVHIYSGSYDLMLNHVGTELTIQNMTWNGAQGFQHKPSQPFIVDGQNAGTWGRERDLSYHLITGAGHEVPVDKPAAAFAFMREFVLGQAGYQRL